MNSLTLKKLLIDGISKSASDIHMGVDARPAMRIDGSLAWCNEYDVLSKEDMKLAVNMLLNKKQQEMYYAQREYDFSFKLDLDDEKTQRFRGNLFFEKDNSALALRIILSNIRTIENLSLPKVISEITQKNRGLFIVTGPTGSGKSTTLASMIQKINITRARHIITIEDPIEYMYSSEKSLIHQREISRDTNSFSEAVISAMRQDPDVIMIGELRDFKTISAAVTAAETGHLVLTTLHTQDASQSIDRIIDVFPPHQQQQIRVQLASTLLGILSQQLIPLATGTGRIAATELLLANSAVRNHIREAKTSQIKNTIQTGLSVGMHTMDQDLARISKEGLITEEEALKHAYDIQELKRNLLL